MNKQSIAVTGFHSTYLPAMKNNKFNSFDQLKINVVQQHLKENLWAQIIVNNPALMLQLQQENSVADYLTSKVDGVKQQIEQMNNEGKPQYIIEELCLGELTADMMPYRFNYLLHVLQEEFSYFYQQWSQSGVLTYETLNLQKVCDPVFDEIGLKEENAEDSQIYHAITASIESYLDPTQQPFH